jgi:HEAT repeat protein
MQCEETAGRNHASETDAGSRDTDVDLDSLIRQLNSDTIFGRRSARETLVELGRCAVPSLMELLKSPVIQIRWESAKALGEIAAPEIIPGLVALLDDEDHGVRWVAARGLINVGPRCLPPVLHRLAEEPRSKSLRGTAHDILHVLSDRYDELRSILTPVMEVLGEVDPAAAIPPRALRAIEQLELLTL